MAGRDVVVHGLQHLDLLRLDRAVFGVRCLLRLRQIHGDGCDLVQFVLGRRALVRRRRRRTLGQRPRLAVEPCGTAHTDNDCNGNQNRVLASGGDRTLQSIGQQCRDALAGRPA